MLSHGFSLYEKHLYLFGLQKVQQVALFTRTFNPETVGACALEFATPDVTQKRVFAGRSTRCRGFYGSRAAGRVLLSFRAGKLHLPDHQ